MRRVVITDVGVIAPNANSFKAFTESLKQGKSGLAEIDCFDASTFPARIVGQVKDLDIPGLQKRFPFIKAANDRKVYIGLLAYLQIADRVVSQSSLCPVNLGSSLEQFLMEKVFKLSPGFFELDTYMKATVNGFNKPYIEAPLDFLGNIIKELFSITGPNYLNCSACTASTQAIGHSFHMIRDGRYDRIITGGFDSMLNPLGLGGFSRLGALCTDNELKEKAIRPFDLRRQGTILGEGAAMLLLEELGFAQKHGHKIYAEIMGYGASFDAFKLSEPDRTGRGIAKAMQAALDDAGITPDHVDYINAHGTGTIANDRVETLAIKSIFENRAYDIPISSVKSMIGHLIGASGAVEIAAVLAMLESNFIAPTINLEKKDPECDLDYMAIAARNEKINVVVKNSMGFGGQNATLVIKRYEEKDLGRMT